MPSYWYWRPLFNAKAIDENTSNTFDLPEQGHLSGLLLKLRQVNAASNYALDNGWPFQQTTLRVWGNGNIPIMDLRGRQLEAINFWETGEMPKNNLWDDISGTVEAYATIPFGRYLGDEKYGLILEKFATGVQLKDENTISTTYFTDGYSKYDIWGLFRKNPEASLFSGGFFSKRNVVTRDANTETQVPYKLPTTKKLRQIYMFAEPSLSSNLPATTPFTLLSNVWLGIKSKEEYMINNADVGQFSRYMYQQYRRKAHTGGLTKVHATDNNFFDTMIYERETTQCTPLGSAGYFATEDAATFWERICKTYAFTATATRVSCYVYVDAKGILYHGLIPLLTVDPMADETTYLDADLNKDVYVEFTEGSSSGYIYIVTDELIKSYPS